jgi:CRISPR type I-E-associated protein CasB/Cse2
MAEVQKTGRDTEPWGASAASWWHHLMGSTSSRPTATGTLAELRRARSTTEAMRIPAALELARRVGAAHGDTPDAAVRSAIDLARVLAHIKEDTGTHPMRAAGWRRFPGARRTSDVPADARPTLSEARFRRLMSVGDAEETVQDFIRLIRQLGGKASVSQVATGFLNWTHPTRGDRTRETWAFVYYNAGDGRPSNEQNTNEEQIG